MLTAIHLRIVWTISSNKYERLIDCMICVMKKLCFAYTKRKVWKSCVADLRIRLRYIITPLNFLNPKFQLPRCCLLDLVGNLEGRFNVPGFTNFPRAIYDIYV